MKFERYSGYTFSFICSMIYYKMFKRIQSTSTRIMMLLFYFTVAFESFYIAGRHLGSFIILKEYLNRYLKYNNGESIISMQAFLFVKTCLIEDEYKSNNKSNLNLSQNQNHNLNSQTKSGIIDVNANENKFEKSIENKYKSNSSFVFDQIFGGIYGRWVKRLGLN